MTRGVAVNEPFITGAVDRVEREVRQLEGDGIPRERIIIGGFSQGACLASKFAFTYPARYGGLFVLSGALPGLLSLVRNDVRMEGFESVNLDGTRVLIACGDSDPLVPVIAPEGTAWAFGQVGAVVDKRIYQGMGHTICQDEKDVLKYCIEEMILNV
jgi:predicted esterase